MSPSIVISTIEGARPLQGDGRRKCLAIITFDDGHIIDIDGSGADTMMTGVSYADGANVSVLARSTPGSA